MILNLFNLSRNLKIKKLFIHSQKIIFYYFKSRRKENNRKFALKPRFLKSFFYPFVLLLLSKSCKRCITFLPPRVFAQPLYLHPSLNLGSPSFTSLPFFRENHLFPSPSFPSNSFPSNIEYCSFLTRIEPRVQIFAGPRWTESWNYPLIFDICMMTMQSCFPIFPR